MLDEDSTRIIVVGNTLTERVLPRNAKCGRSKLLRKNFISRQIKIDSASNNDFGKSEIMTYNRVSRQKGV